MIIQSLERGPARPEAWSALLVPRLERLLSTLCWIFWMLSPIPAELAEPALRQMTGLRARAWRAVRESRGDWQ